MPTQLNQLCLAELRDLCRQHGLPESYDADRMRWYVQRVVTQHLRNDWKTQT